MSYRQPRNKKQMGKIRDRIAGGEDISKECRPKLIGPVVTIRELRDLSFAGIRSWLSVIGLIVDGK